MEGCEQFISKDGETTIYMREGKVVAKCVKNFWKEIWYNADGKRHRDGDLPAEIWYGNGGKSKHEEWYLDGKRHRDGDLPAMILYRSGKKAMEEWYRDDKPHRDGDRPAMIQYNEDGAVICQTYYCNGKQYVLEKPKVGPIAEQMAIIEAATAKIRELLAKK